VFELFLLEETVLKGGFALVGDLEDGFGGPEEMLDHGGVLIIELHDLVERTGLCECSEEVCFESQLSTFFFHLNLKSICAQFFVTL
jgi:hypothetical protein